MAKIRASLTSLSALAALFGALAAFPAGAQGGDPLVCARNNTGVLVARANVTFYTGPGEARWDSGWQTLTQGQQYCQRRSDLRAFNVTIQVTDTTGWRTVCDVNRRPGMSLVAEAYANSRLSVSCQAL